MRRLALAAVLPALALVAAGCGAAQSASGGFQGTRGDVAQVVSDLSTAARRKDAQKICTQILARDLQQRVSAGTSDCQSEIKKATDDADDFDLQVRSVTVTGNQATAQVRTGADGPVTRFSFVHENGDWRISGLG
jgi:hypothetical protein